MENQAADSKIVNIQKILEILPHRYPFVLVDRILAWEADKSITGLKNVTINEPFFQGHFPAISIMPGVLGLESMAQTACVLAFLSSPEMIGNKFPNFTGLDKVYFRGAVRPGDQLILKIDIIKKKMGIYKMEAKAFVEENLVTEAILKATFIDKSLLM